MPDLSIAMIVKNEEINLPDLFESISNLRKQLSVQVVIVDTGSTDNTISFALDQGAEVFNFDWCNDFSAARNESLKYCTGKWILWLDADDIISRDLSDWLIKRCITLDTSNVYLFDIESPLQTGGILSWYQTRLFPNNDKIGFTNPVQETLLPSIQGRKSLVYIRKQITHAGYFVVEQLKEKKERNDSILKGLTSSNEPTILYALARTYQFEGKHKLAAEFFKRIIDMDTKDDVYDAAYIYYGQELGYLNQLSKAFTHFHFKSQSIGTFNPLYCHEWGKICYALYMPKDAKELIERSQSLMPYSWTIPTNWEAIKTEGNLILKETEYA